MIVRTTAAFLLVFVTLACGSDDLTREVAKDLIQKDPKFATVSELVADDASLARALEDRILEPRPFEGFGRMVDGSTGSGPYRVSAKGLGVFSLIQMSRFTLQEPVKRTVSEITGITNGPQETVKVAKFYWHFPELPSTVSKYTGVSTADHEGEAQFRRYDDGWRVEGIEFGAMHGGGNPRALTPDARFPPVEPRYHIVNIARGWEARATDTNTYHLYNANIPSDPSAPDGPQTVADLQRALSPIYVSAGKFLETDPYGHAYHFVVSGNGNNYSISSFGKDGKEGGSDDYVYADGRWLSLPAELTAYELGCR